MTKLKDMKFKDMKLLHFRNYAHFIKKENEAQLEQWGTQEARLTEWLAWTTEEYGEFAKAINHYIYENGSVEDVFNEGIQTITLILKMIETIRNY